MIKLGMGRKKKVKYLPAPKSAKYDHDKKLNKKVKKALAEILKKDNNKEKEESMKTNFNIILSFLSLVVIILASYQFTFQTGAQYSEIKSGIKQNSKSLNELIEINKSSVKRVSVLERKSDKAEIYINLNRVEIKRFKK